MDMQRDIDVNKRINDCMFIEYLILLSSGAKPTTKKEAQTLRQREVDEAGRSTTPSKINKRISHLNTSTWIYIYICNI